MSDRENQTTRTPPWTNRLEADVTFSDGTVHRVTGLYAVEYRKNPEKVGPQIEKHYREFRQRMDLADDLERQGFGRSEALRRAAWLTENQDG
jgi:hypothetical protein